MQFQIHLSMSVIYSSSHTLLVANGIACLFSFWPGNKDRLLAWERGREWCLLLDYGGLVVDLMAERK
jgi:hypothetical protein